jgi:peroxiredoxin
MKRQFLSLIVVLAAYACPAQQKFTIKGTLGSLASEGKVKLMRYNVLTDKIMEDSAELVKGSFVFNGQIEGIENSYLFIVSEMDEKGNRKFDRQEFYLEKGLTTVRGKNIETALITGGPAQTDYNALKKQLQPLEEERQPFYSKLGQLRKDKNEAGIKELHKQMEPIQAKIEEVKNGFIKKYPDSYVSLSLVKEKGSAFIEPDKITPYFMMLSKRLRTSREGKQLADRIELAKRTAVGQPALVFTQSDTNGTPVSLQSLQGKYVLIDFWASWCAPCRAENPQIKKAYEKYRGRNFEIIAVSLDEKKEPWLKAIEKDGLPWIHVSDLKGFKNSVALQYGVTAIPQNFLIDPNGIIVASNLRGEELEKKLEELYSKKGT